MRHDKIPYGLLQGLRENAGGPREKLVVPKAEIILFYFFYLMEIWFVDLY